MEKIVIHQAGGYRELKMESHPDPKPGPGEVLVRTRGIGVNYADVCVRWGVYASAKLYVGWPITPGFEFSGEVIATGPGVTRVKAGDAVYGITRFGAYSTHVCVPEHQAFPLPKQLTFDQAAGFLAVYLTAYHALCQQVRVRPDMWALVHSAAGGVGTALLQIARVLGVHTVAVVGASHKVETARRFGATHVIDKSSQDLWTEAERLAPDGFDLILDANGYSTLKQGYKHLKPSGKLVTYGFHAMLPKKGGHLNYLKAAWGLIRMPRFNPMQLVDQNRGVVGFNVSFLFDRKDILEEAMRDLTSWLEQGKIVGPVVESFAFKDAVQAHRRIESGQSVGKLVLKP